MTGSERDASTTPAQRLGAALRGLQQRSGRTLRALEEQVSISDSSLSRYFRGDTVPPWPVVRDLCRALGADPSEYRALWEATDRDRSESPPNPPPPNSSPPASTPRRPIPGSRWTFAAAGILIGLLVGFLLAFLVVRSSNPRDPSSFAHNVPAADTSDSAAEPSEHSRVLVSRATGNCLDHSLDKGLRAFACNGMSYQWWAIHTSSGGTSELRNHATGMCLADSTDPSAQPCDGSGAQEWTLVTHEDNAVSLKNNSTGNCLDDSSTGLRLLPCGATASQKWG